MDQFVEGKNPYAILGLEGGKQSTLDEIKKAYRRLALIKHPDKAKTPNAAQEFDELKKAYAILTDKSTRGALDDYLDAQAAREARLNKQDAKRQRMRSELERKEKEGAKAKNEEEQARAKLQVELEALRARAQHEQQERHAKQQAGKVAAASRAADAAAAATAAAKAAGDSSDDETTQLLLRTVKVSWDPSVGAYTTERLREIFAAGWSVEDVILKDSRKKKKASALVVLTSSEDAQSAAQQVHGDLTNPLLVMPYLRVVHGQQQQQKEQQQPTSKRVDGSSQASGSAGQQNLQDSATGGHRQPLFASGLAGATSRPSQKPSKPLFPGAAQQPQGSEIAGPDPPKFSSFPATASNGSGQQPAAAGSQFSSFPSKSVGQQRPASSSNFSSFPSATSVDAAGSKINTFSFPAPAGGAAGVPIVPVGHVYEDAVLGKLQKKATATEQQP